jgi:hypothetical protein
MCLRFVFLLITRIAGWLRLSRREEAWKTAALALRLARETSMELPQNPRELAGLGVRVSASASPCTRRGNGLRSRHAT